MRHCIDEFISDRRTPLQKQHGRIERTGTGLIPGHFLSGLHILGPGPLGAKPPFPVQVSLSLGAFHFFVLPPLLLGAPNLLCDTRYLTLPASRAADAEKDGTASPFIFFCIEKPFCLSVFAGEQGYYFIHTLLPLFLLFHVLYFTYTP